MARFDEVRHNPPVAEKPLFAGITPRRSGRRRRHVVAVVAFDGVVFGDLAASREVFGRVHDAHDVRPTTSARAVCLNTESAHVNLTVRWPLKLLRKADTIVVPGIDDLARSMPDAVGPLLLWIEQNLRTICRCRSSLAERR